MSLIKTAADRHRVYPRTHLNFLFGVFLGLFCHPAMAFVAATALNYETSAASQALDHTTELHCLALNVYHEARGEPEQGRYAVALVTLNRVHSPNYPNSVCGVVWQRGQFSWTRDGHSDIPQNPNAWGEALEVATEAYETDLPSNVGAATYFHVVDVLPSWSKTKRKVRTIGRHVFYEP